MPAIRCARKLLAAGLAAVALAVAMPASAEEYDSKYSGHPVRIAAYVLHPIGVFIDYVILRPAYWIGSHEPFATIFGREK